MMIEFFDGKRTGWLSEKECADLARVTDRTIRRLKNGEGSHLLREFLTLHATRRILPAAWLMTFTAGEIHTNTGYSLTQGQIEQYGWHIGTMNQALEKNRQLEDEISRLKSIISGLSTGWTTTHERNQNHEEIEISVTHQPNTDSLRNSPANGTGNTGHRKQHSNGLGL